MTIEFFGLPGSGKSTLSHAVATILAERGIDVAEVTYDIDRKYRRPQRAFIKLCHFVGYFLHSPHDAFSSFACIAATRQARLIDLGKSLFNWMFIASLSTRARKSRKVTILDQGIAQALWSIDFAAQADHWLEELLTRSQGDILKPNIIIYVRADHDIIGFRLAGRKVRTSRLDHLGQDWHRLQHAQARSDAILRTLASYDIRIIKVLNNNPRQLHSLAEALADTIVETMGSLTVIDQKKPLHSPPAPAFREHSPVGSLGKNKSI